MWNEAEERFYKLHAQTLTLEHSLISISKWEAKWHKPFQSTEKKTNEETLDYIRCMTLSPNVDPYVYYYIRYDKKILRQINDYIANPMSATKVESKKREPKSGQYMTSELIYSYMIDFGIPFDPCEKWHFNRLIKLIEVRDAQNSSGVNKMSNREVAKMYSELNKARRAKFHSKG